MPMLAPISPAERGFGLDTFAIAIEVYIIGAGH